MKKILVPTDFSLQAENALKVAAQLAKKHGCEIYLLHILEVSVHTIDPVSTYNNLPEAMFFMKLAHKQFEELKNKDTSSMSLAELLKGRNIFLIRHVILFLTYHIIF